LTFKVIKMFLFWANLPSQLPWHLFSSPRLPSTSQTLSGHLSGTLHCRYVVLWPASHLLFPHDSINSQCPVVFKASFEIYNCSGTYIQLPIEFLHLKTLKKLFDTLLTLRMTSFFTGPVC
jgi:hypothetical protein